MYFIKSLVSFLTIYLFKGKTAYTFGVHAACSLFKNQLSELFRSMETWFLPFNGAP